MTASPLTSKHADIALLTDRRYTASQAHEDDWYLRNILRDDALLQQALEDAGLSSVRVDWADPDVDWSGFRCAVFRTTWDYFERLPEFTGWLDRASTQTRLCNDPRIIRWNLDKHYLADLTDKGIPVVPTRFIEAKSTVDLPRLLEENGWQEAVIKPCISGGAWHTYRISKSNAATLQTVIQPLLSDGSFLIQPFLADIQKTGEDTLVIIDGRFTHAVRKVAKEGDFRVQDDHGGTVHPLRPTSDQIELAERTMAACPGNPVYGRVDMVRDDDGQWSVMELELIEPELWLRHHPEAASIFGNALARMLR